MTRILRIAALFLMLTLLSGSPAQAQDCTNPARPEGKIIYNTDFDVMQYCGGGVWKQLYWWPPAGPCPIGYTPNGNRCYRVFPQDNFAAGRSRCQADGGDLAEVNDATENSYLATNYGSIAWSYIGHTDSNTEGTWTSVLGGSSFTNWAAGQPVNSTGTEDCAVLRADGTWNATLCANWAPFICEVPAGSGNCPSGLIAHWKLDESSGTTADDFVGTNNGTVNGGAVWQPGGGKYGGALQFDGVDDYVNVPSSAAFDIATATWSLWVKTNGAWGTDNTDPSNHALLMGRDDFTIPMTPTSYYSHPLMGIENGIWCESWETINDNQWHHIVAVYSQNASARNTIWVDGKPANICYNPGTSWAFNNQPIGFGGSASAFYEEFAGLIDDVRIYNRQLATTEISALYSGNCQ